MRLIKMTGGLGNQMFIYAMSMAMKHRFPDTRIDLSDMVHYHDLYGYELHRIFSLPEDEFCINQTAKKVMEFLFFRTILERKQNLETLDAYRKPYRWPLVYFKGFYQDERYFKHIEAEVRQAFRFDLTKANAESRELAARIKTDPCAISLHVRRGDYLKGNLWLSNGCVCQKGYYNIAVKIARGLFPEGRFYVFSEDTDWVKQNIPLPESTTYVNCNRGEDSWQDMMLMSLCHHNIICNNTFSWWAAWLNENEEKTVLCPDHWYAGDGGHSRLILKGWYRVQTDD